MARSDRDVWASGSGRARDKVRWPLLALLSSAAVLFALRLGRMGSVGLDGGIYLEVASQVEKGNILYKTIPESKPPLFHFLNAWWVHLVGNDYAAVFVIFILIAAATSLVIYLLIVEIISNQPAGLVGALLFSIFSSLPLSELYWIMTEPYLIFFELACLLFLIRGLKGGRWYDLLFAGTLLSSAFLVRQTAFVFLFVVGAAVLVLLYRRVGGRASFALICMGALVPFVAIIAYFASVGGLDQMIEEVFLLAPSTTASQASAAMGPAKDAWLLGALSSSAPLIFLSLFAPFPPGGRGRTCRAAVLVLIAWTVAVIAFYRFTPIGIGFTHEYAETLGPLSVLAALGAVSVCSRLSGPERRRCAFRSPEGARGPVVKVLAAAMLLILLGGTCFASYTVSTRPDEHTTKDLPVAMEIADHIRAGTDPSEPIFVFETGRPKLGPLVYFQSDRDPATFNRSFFFPAEITDADREQVLRSLEDPRLRYVVLIGGPPEQGAGWENAGMIYNAITSDFVPIKELGAYDPYPGLAGEMPVVIYARDGR